MFLKAPEMCTFGLSGCREGKKSAKFWALPPFWPTLRGPTFCSLGHQPSEPPPFGAPLFANLAEVELANSKKKLAEVEIGRSDDTHAQSSIGKPKRSSQSQEKKARISDEKSIARFPKVVRGVHR